MDLNELRYLADGIFVYLHSTCLYSTLLEVLKVSPSMDSTYTKEQLFNSLLGLNRMAVNNTDFSNISFVSLYKSVECVDLMQTYKYLEVWLYQCFETVVEQCTLYKLMVQVAGFFARLILQRQGAYQNGAPIRYL